MSKLNEKLRTLMANQSWSQKSLAERMFVSPDTISSWVRQNMRKLNVSFHIQSATTQKISRTLSTSLLMRPWQTKDCCTVSPMLTALNALRSIVAGWKSGGITESVKRR